MSSTDAKLTDMRRRYREQTQLQDEKRGVLMTAIRELFDQLEVVDLPEAIEQLVYFHPGTSLRALGKDPLEILLLTAWRRSTAEIAIGADDIDYDVAQHLLPILKLMRDFIEKCEGLTVLS